MAHRATARAQILNMDAASESIVQPSKITQSIEWVFLLDN